jgi:hypothetical protein
MAVTAADLTVDQLSGRIGAALALRAGCRTATAGLVIAGTMALAGRIIAQWPASQAAWVLAPFALAVGMMAWRAWRGRPAATSIRALLDQRNEAGGLLMAGETSDISAWAGSLAGLKLPRVRWAGQRALLLLSAATAFLLAVLFIPDEQLRWRSRQPLEIGEVVRQLEAQIEVLAEENLIEDSKAEELKVALEDMQKQAMAEDPARTWEALDHLRQSAAEKAERAAEEMLARLSEISAAETLAAALAQASTNMSPDVAGLALAELHQLAAGTVSSNLAANLAAALSTHALSTQDLGQLASALAGQKARLGKSLTNLSQLKLIDAKRLSQCQGACQGGNTNALAAFLSECSSTNGACESLLSLCRGGVNRGRGDAPMTWMDPSSEEGAGFKEETLPSSGFDPAQAELVAITRAAPETADPSLPLTAGGLDQATAGGGAAYAQRILPRHRPAVDRFFKRQP